MRRLIVAAFIFAGVQHPSFGQVPGVGGMVPNTPIGIVPTLTVTGGQNNFPFLLENGNSSVSFPVPSFYPTGNNQNIAVDIFPHGNPGDVTLTGTAWLDICNKDIIVNGGAAFGCAHVASYANGDAQFASTAFNGATPGNLVFSAGATTIAKMSTSATATAGLAWISGAAANGGQYGGSGSTYDATLVNNVGAVGAGVPTGTTLLTAPSGIIVGSASQILLTDAIGIRTTSNGIISASFRNANAGAAAQMALYFDNSTNLTGQASIILNGGGFSGGQGANALSISNASTAPIFLGTGTEVIKMPSLVTDATHADRSVCQDSSSGQIYFGSGTLGICLGTSSARFKHDIAPLTAGLDQIMKLEPVAYHLNADHGDPNKLLYGFTAEQGSKVLPALGGVDAGGKPNTFDYLGVVPVLVKGMQQLKAENDNLRACNDNWKCRLFGMGR